MKSAIRGNVGTRLRKLDPMLREAAADLGADSWQVFRYVTFPLLRPAIWGAVLVAFTVSLDDFLVTFFTAGPGATTLPMRLYSAIRLGVSPEINAACTIMIGAVAVVPFAPGVTVAGSMRRES